MITYNDATTIYDEIDISYDGYSVLSDLVSDSIMVSDSTGKALTRVIVDNVNASENVNRLTEYFRVNTDTINVGDNVSKSIILNRLVTDTIEIADNVKKSLSRILVDTINISDKAIKTISTTIIDTINISENVSKVATFYRSVVDTISSNDIIKRCLNGITTFFSNKSSNTSSFTNKSSNTSEFTNKDKSDTCN